MHVKPSGIVMVLSALVLLTITIVGVWRLFTLGAPTITTSNGIVLPDYLANKSDNRFPVYTDRLTNTWSRKTTVVANYGPEVIPLEDGAIADVRCNGDENYRVSVDSLARVFVKGKQVYGMAHTAICYYLEVKAGTPESIGKGYVVSMVAMKK